MKKRALVVLLCACMALGTLAGCGQTEQKESKQTSQSVDASQASKSEATSSTADVEQVEEVTYPMKTDVDLSVFWIENNATVKDDYKSWEESPFHSGLAERTGLAIDWKFPVKGADYQQAFNLVWNEKELPDIIVAAGIEVTEAQQLCEDGLIWDLTDYLPTYAPDWWEIMNSSDYEMVKKLHTANDGRIYSICTINDNAYGQPYQGVMIRQDWLEEQDLEVPVTLEDYEKVLKVFKEKYGAGLTFTPGHFTAVALTSGTGCYGGLGGDFYRLNGEVRYAQADEQYKEYLTIMNRWYEEGLIDSDVFGNDDNSVRAKALNDQAGMVLGAQSGLINFINDAKEQNKDSNWIGIEYPRTAKGEPTTWIAGGAKINYRGANLSAIITTACSEEEMIEALKWINYGFTEEGIYYWGYGEEGVTYNKTANGGIEWTDLILKHELGESEAKARYTGMSGNGMSLGLQTVTEAALNPKQIEGRLAWRENTVAGEHSIPSLVYTEEESEVISQYFASIQTYTKEQSFKFISGEVSLDKWDEYIKTLNEFGLEKVQKAYQSAVDRCLN